MDSFDLFTLAGLVVGVIAKGFAVYQSYEANAHATRAEFLLEINLKALQNNGLADLKLDENGQIDGMNLKIIGGWGRTTATR